MIRRLPICSEPLRCCCPAGAACKLGQTGSSPTTCPAGARGDSRPGYRTQEDFHCEATKPRPRRLQDTISGTAKGGPVRAMKKAVNFSVSVMTGFYLVSLEGMGSCGVGWGFKRSSAPWA